MATWKQNYRKTRNMTWLYYALAFVFFIMAIKAYPVGGGSMIGFMFWTAATTGLVFGAGRAKRKAKRLERGE
jgi:predicted anti-sigma-YlaC factor YlaD